MDQQSDVRMAAQGAGECPPELARELADAIGERRVLLDEAARTEASGDATRHWGRPAIEREVLPWAVLRPESTEQAAASVAVLNRRRVPIVPYGGGSGLMGGAVTTRPGVVIDLREMGRVLEFSPQDRSVHVQAGAVLKGVNAMLEDRGFILGHDPWSLPVATVGGAISTNGLGYLAGRYGSMGEQVLGLTVVLASGEVLRIPALAKRSTGFDLKQLFIGAEGTMGVITEAVLKALPRPEVRRLLALTFPSFEAGFGAIQEVLALGLRPAIADYGDHFEPASGLAFPRSAQTPGMAPVLHLALDGFREEVAAQEQRLREVCEAHGGEDLGQDVAHEFWEHRHDSGDRFLESRLSGRRPQRAANATYEFLNMVVPASRVLEYRRRALTILEANEVDLLESGFWGSPELFALFIARAGRDGEDVVASLGAVSDQLMMLAQDMGGSMEQCHGVGLRRAHLMEREHGIGLEVMRQLKRTLDPNDIMNPGKLALD
jgi:alkyldihydroxyacetonephosphate synthase